MLAFIRKIRHSLIDSGATRKYLVYATGEIALVVIGILIALQINNWNEGRKERIKEKEVLQDILANLNRNNELIRESLILMDEFDKSSNIILTVLKKEQLYSDTLTKHFFSATRTGGLLFPLSSEGYESLKNEGFDIIRSGLLKDRILELFEVAYERIKIKAQWTINSTDAEENYIGTLFRQESGEIRIPINYGQLLKDDRFYSIVVSIKESKRGFLKQDIIDCLEESEKLIDLIKDGLIK
ncbi:MAG: hypothetical protein IPL46_19330 [Saprospiraceae bacterium]|nr:hypothetical protein [Saprospiraceae bacterium]